MGKRHNIKVGDKYNHLTVLELKAKKGTDGKWLHKCQCDCENKTICYARGYELANNTKMSCGCLLHAKRPSLEIGSHYGKWTILEYKGNSKYLCQCSCEDKTLHVLDAYTLTSGSSTSCGCSIKKYNLKVGDKFGDLVIEELRSKVNKDKHYLHKCRCKCGNICYVRSYDLVRGHNTSCGCGNVGISNVHHETNTRFYRIWRDMKTRCLCPSASAYKHYGGRGIKVCERWLEYSNFREDMYESYQKHVEQYGERDTSIDRINVNGNYEPTNCRWATCKEQANNTRNNRYLTDYDGTTRTIEEWAKIKGLKRETIDNRIYRLKWDETKAINTPVLS